MGQRTQAIIKFKNNKNEDVKVTFHNQWGFGRILIYAAYAVLKAIETEIISDEYSFELENERMFEKLSTIMKVNVENGIYTNWSLYGEDETFVPMSDCENDDGFIILDITDLKNPKYAFVKRWFIEITKEEYKGILNDNLKYSMEDAEGDIKYYEINYQVLNPFEYWDIYEEGYMKHCEKEEFSNLEEQINKWINYILDKGYLLNKRDLDEYF